MMLISGDSGTRLKASTTYGHKSNEPLSILSTVQRYGDGRNMTEYELDVDQAEVLALEIQQAAMSIRTHMAREMQRMLAYEKHIRENKT